MRITRRYFGCCTRRVTSTTMVFSIFALVTLPTSSVRAPRSATAVFCVSTLIPVSSRLLCSLRTGRSRQLERAKPGLPPRQILFGFPQLLQRFGLAGRELETQPENGFAQLLLLSLEFVHARFTDLVDAPGHISEPSRTGDEFGRNRQLVRRERQGLP